VEIFIEARNGRGLHELRVVDEFGNSGSSTSHENSLMAIVDFASTQTYRHELQVLENARRRERMKKARQRAAKARYYVRAQKNLMTMRSKRLTRTFPPVLALDWPTARQYRSLPGPDQHGYISCRGGGKKALTPLRRRS
jgi:hypothetical protein